MLCPIPCGYSECARSRGRLGAQRGIPRKISNSFLIDEGSSVAGSSAACDWAERAGSMDQLLIGC